jgi:hypothetical protein
MIGCHCPGRRSRSTCRRARRGSRRAGRERCKASRGRRRWGLRCPGRCRCRRPGRRRSGRECLFASRQHGSACRKGKTRRRRGDGVLERNDLVSDEIVARAQPVSGGLGLRDCRSLARFSVLVRIWCEKKDRFATHQHPVGTRCSHLIFADLVDFEPLGGGTIELVACRGIA